MTYPDTPRRLLHQCLRFIPRQGLTQSVLSFSIYWESLFRCKIYHMAYTVHKAYIYKTHTYMDFYYTQYVTIHNNYLFVDLHICHGQNFEVSRLRSPLPPLGTRFPNMQTYVIFPQISKCSCHVGVAEGRRCGERTGEDHLVLLFFFHPSLVSASGSVFVWLIQLW